MKRRDVFEVWYKYRDPAEVLQYVLAQCNIVSTTSAPRQLKLLISSLCSKMLSKWEKSQRHKNRFLLENKVWLDGDILIPENFLSAMPSTSGSQPPSQRGRPSKPLKQCKAQVQRRKLKEFVKSTPAENLTIGAEIILRKSGKKDAANIVRELSFSSPRRATNIKKARRFFNRLEPKLSPKAALGLLIDAKLSLHQYKIIQQQAKSVKSNLFPPYYKLQEAKNECYPPEDAISITDHSAEVKLQSLLDLTAQRIAQLQQEVLDLQQQVSAVSLRLISKWGCDGSSAQSRYNQKLSSEFSDENLFSVTFVPLRLINETTNAIIWQNPRPNSTRFCRLIRFSYKKETKELIKSETDNIKSQIQNLVPTTIQLNNIVVECRHELLLTMVDGKVCSSLSEYSSSQKCYICGATPKEMNSEGPARRPPEEEMYSFGISPLHAWIRLFECLLHISYKLEIRKWRATTAEDKSSVAARKSAIQYRFKSEVGLLVDMPKQSTGNTNTGNTARVFFRNAEKSAEITGLDRNLIFRFCAILEALACDYELNAEKFNDYAQETRKLYLALYSWYPMPATVHKILMHAKDIIKTCILPLGQLAEEAQEASNKEYRRNREFFSRKISREATNRDIINRFLLSSDPLLSSNCIQKSRKRHALPTDTIQLLKATDIEEDISSSDED